MAYKDKGLGSLVVDRRTLVGRIKLASGTTDPKLHRRLNTMLRELSDAGRADYLRAIRDRRLTLLAAYELYRVHGAAKLPSLEQLQGLRAAMTEWIASAECGVAQRVAHRTAMNHLLAGAPPDAQMSDLPRLLQAVRDRLKAKRHHAQFNRVRSSAQAFVRDTLRRQHPLYADVSGVDELKERKQRRNNPQTPKELEALATSLSEPRDRAALWGMALTGMGPAEWFGTWRVVDDERGVRVHIAGTKRESRVRDVPLVWSERFTKVARAPRGEDVRWSIRRFQDLLRDVTDGAIKPYDLRRTYATWLELAGIPRTRRRLYLGHSVGDVTDLYEFQDTVRYLADDAKRIAEYLTAGMARGSNG